MQWHERIGRRLRLRDLHILLAVVEHRSMAKAAAALAISQPAVSRAVADLEHTVGQRLLDRSRQGVEPTLYGETLVRRGFAVFDELKQTAQELDFLADPTVGELRIGSQEAMAAGLLPAIIDQFSRRYPRVKLSVAQVVFAAAHYRDLRERSIDLLFGRMLPPFVEDDLEFQSLYDDQPVLVTGRRHRLASARALALSDLVEEEWIVLSEDSLPGAMLQQIFRAAQLRPPRGSLSTLSIHLILQLVPTGRYVSMLPGSVLRFGRTKWPIKVLPVTLPALPRPIGMVRLKNRTLSPVAQAFIECARLVVS
jgi:DNA-binding transcriptional LysR family regulator